MDEFALKRPLLTNNLEVKGGYSLASATFVQTHNAIGMNILLFPYTFWAFGGLWEAIVAELVLIVFVGPSLLIMAHSAEVKQALSYQDVVSHLCGPILGFISQLCIALGGFGACIATLIYIGDQLVDLSSAFETSDGSPLSEKWYFDRRFSIPVLATVFILPLLMLKNIGSLSYSSLIGFLSSLYIVGVIMAKYFVIDDDYLNCNTSFNTERTCHTSWTQAACSISFICAAYMCHISAVSLYVEINKRSVRRYAVVVVTVMSSCLIVYSVTGLFGYLTFNGRVCISGDILRSYCPRDIPISIARVMIVVSLITLYPIICYNGRLALDSTIIELFAVLKFKSVIIESRHILRARMESTTWFCLSVGIAIFIPDILKVMGPMGGVAALYMLTFPGLCLLNMMLDNLIEVSSDLLRLFLYLVAGVYIAIGCYICGSSVTYSIMSETHLIS